MSILLCPECADPFEYEIGWYNVTNANLRFCSRECLRVHMKEKREIVYTTATNDGHWGGCSSESDYPCDCPYREKMETDNEATIS